MDESSKDLKTDSSVIDQPIKFINKLLLELEGITTADSKLLSILKDHILKENLSSDAVERALKEVKELAKERSTEE